MTDGTKRVFSPKPTVSTLAFIRFTCDVRLRYLKQTPGGNARNVSTRVKLKIHCVILAFSRHWLVLRERPLAAHYSAPRNTPLAIQSTRGAPRVNRSCLHTA